MESALILLVAVVAGISAENCCYPDEFEIDLGLVAGYVYGGQGSVAALVSKIAFDYNQKRVAEIFSVYADGIQLHYHTILDYEKGVIYAITEHNCEVGDLTTNMTHCIPDAVKPAGSSYLGDSQLTLESYSGHESSEEGSGIVTLSVTKGECIPVSTGFIGQFEEDGLLTNGGFTGYVEGIKNPSSFFDVPSYCPKTFSKTKKPKKFKHHLNLLYL